MFVYKIIFKNEERDITDEITSDDILELIQKNVFMAETGIIGLSPQAVKNYITNL